MKNHRPSTVNYKLDVMKNCYCYDNSFCKFNHLNGDSLGMELAPVLKISNL